MVNEHKSRVAKITEGEFLGFTFRGTKGRWSVRAFEDFKHPVRRLTGRRWGVSRGYRLNKLAPYVRGWMSYFGLSDDDRPIPKLDPWRRRRVRMGYSTGNRGARGVPRYATGWLWGRVNGRPS